MGIRFNCPNGHKLNVKAFLAGKRGICPHCGARFLIPHENQVLEAATAGNGRETEVELEQPLAEPASTASSTLRESNLPDSPTPESDPIAVAPEAVWYVRPPSGGQYGPAAGDVMRRWLDEGRISSDSLVWREGWSDWKEAGPVFPALFPTLQAAPTVENPPPAPTAPKPAPKRPEISIATEADKPAGEKVNARLKARRHRKSLALIVFLGLLAILIVLVVALIAVIQRSPTT